MKNPRPKMIVMLIIAAIIVVFIVQNSSVVTVDVLFWRIRTPIVFIISGCFAFGFLVGQLFPLRKK